MWNVWADDVVGQIKQHSRKIGSCLLERLVEELVVDEISPIVLTVPQEFRRQLLLVIFEESRIKLIKVAAHCLINTTYTSSTIEQSTTHNFHYIGNIWSEETFKD